MNPFWVFSRVERFLRRKVLREWLYALPPFGHFRRARRVALLRLVMNIIRENDLPCLVGGGFACAALRGRVVRAHSDVDVIYPVERREEVVKAFSDAGFRTVKADALYALAMVSPVGMAADLYGWRDLGNGMVQRISAGVATRVPREWIERSREVDLHGVRVRIPCNEFLRMLAPHYRREEDRQLVLSLPIDGEWQESEAKQEILEPLDIVVREIHTFRTAGSATTE